MVIEFVARFKKDLKRVSPEVRTQVAEMIDRLEMAHDLESSGVDYKRMQGQKKTENYYRIRIGGYRVGIEYLLPSVILLRVLKRGDAYKHFPPK
ncbi:type II toxin-antitoxin system RelE/ParE family toxin [Persicitalea sp.]|uniref:type II toxin-antitoxin system RelE family toxin n=1 Tax=Persicitalea sp. TaxID=3100273 RepID=UPI003592EEF1